MSAPQIAKSIVLIDSQQAEAALKKLGEEASRLAGKMNAARKANDKAGFDKAQKQYKAANREMKSYKKTVVDVTSVLNNLNGTSLKKLSATQRKLQTEINSMNRTTKQEIVLYNQKVVALKAVKAQTALLRTEMNNTNMAQQSFLSKMAGGFNKYSMMAMSAVASTIAIITVLKQAISIANEFESSVANLSALTGMQGDKLEWLRQRALDLAGSTTEAGVRITISAQEIVDAYTQMGSKRPELLQNKKALAEVTEQAILLASAAKIELAPATLALATTLNMFNASADEAPRYVNVLAAAARSGAADVNFLTGILGKAGTAADQAGLSIEQTVAAAETIAPKFKESSRGGTQLKNLFIKLTDGADKFNPKIVGLSTALDNLAKANLSAGDKIKMFGLRNLTAADTLIKMRHKYENFLEVITDTNTATEQAIINTETQKAKLETYGVMVNKLAIQLGNELVPALSFSTKGFGKIIKVVLAITRFTKEYWVQIVIVTNALIALKTVLMLQAKWTAISSAAIAAKTAILKAYAWTVWTVTDATKIATAAQKAWNWAIRLNPAAILITTLAALGTALYFYTKKSTDAEIATRKLTKAIGEERKSIAKHKVELQNLVAIAADVNLSYTDRQNALGQLMQISPKYLGNLTLEKLALGESNEELEKYIAMLELKAKAQAYQDTLVQIEKDLIQLRLNNKIEDLSFWENAVAIATSGGNATALAFNVYSKQVQNGIDKENTLLAQQTIILADQAKNNAKLYAGSHVPDNNAKEVTNLRSLNEQLAKKKKDRQEINKLDEKALILNAKETEAIEKQIKAIDSLGKSVKKTTAEKNIDATDKYLQKIINADKSLIAQEEIAHNDRLKKAGIYGIKNENLTKKQLLALEALTVKYINNVVKIENKAEKDKSDKLKKIRAANLEYIKQAQDTELLQLQTKHANELSFFKGSDKQKKDLIKLQNNEEIKLRIKHLSFLQELLDNTMNLSIEESMLSDEELAALQFKIEQVKLALATLNLELSGNNEDNDVAGKGKFWQFMFGLDEDAKLADKIQAIGDLAVQTFSDINRIISNGEQKQLQEYETNNRKKQQLLAKRLNDGVISQETYTAQMSMLEEELDAKKRKLEYDQAKRVKAIAIMSAVVNTASGIARAFKDFMFPASLVVAGIVGALGAVQIAAIATEPLPALADGNSAEVLADNGKVYNANVTDNKHKSGLFDKPTVVPGFGIFGETAKPELVFNPVDTQRIMDTPALVDAINMTVKGAPVYAQGNSREIITNNNTSETFTDPAMLEMLTKINDRLEQPSKSYLVADEDYIIIHNDKLNEYTKFQNKVN